MTACAGWDGRLLHCRLTLNDSARCMDGHCHTTLPHLPRALPRWLPAVIVVNSTPHYTRLVPPLHFPVVRYAPRTVDHATQTHLPPPLPFHTATPPFTACHHPAHPLLLHTYYAPAYHFRYPATPVIHYACLLLLRVVGRCLPATGYLDSLCYATLPLTTAPLTAPTRCAHRFGCHYLPPLFRRHAHTLRTFARVHRVEPGVPAPRTHAGWFHTRGPPHTTTPVPPLLPDSHTWDSPPDWTPPRTTTTLPLHTLRHH